MPKRYQVLISATAESDIKSARAFFARDKPSAAEKWSSAIKRQIRTLASFPLRHEVIPEATEIGGSARHAILGNYRIVYQVGEESVTILRVIHEAQLLDRRRLFES